LHALSIASVANLFATISSARPIKSDRLAARLNSANGSAERFHRRRNGPTAQHKEGKMDEVEQADELGRCIISRAARVYDEKLMT
jgi:hypothetical protein